METLTTSDKYFLRELANQLVRIANKLDTAAPGHVEFISKSNAADVCFAVAVDICKRFPLE